MAISDEFYKTMQYEMQRDAMLAAQEVKNFIWAITPVKTGNLRNRSLRMYDSGDYITIYYDSIIAPYIKYPALKRKLDNVKTITEQKFFKLLELKRPSRAAFDPVEVREQLSDREIAFLEEQERIL